MNRIDQAKLASKAEKRRINRINCKLDKITMNRYFWGSLERLIGNGFIKIILWADVNNRYEVIQANFRVKNLSDPILGMI